MVDALAQEDPFGFSPDSAFVQSRSVAPKESTDDMLTRRIQTSLDREEHSIDDARRSMARETDLATKRAETLAPLRQRAMDIASQPLPEPPRMEKSPEVPKSSHPHEDENWLMTAALLGSLAGAFTRKHVTNALGAFQGALEGYAQGSRQRFDENMKVWEAENKRVQDTNEKALTRYRDILQNRKLSAEQISVQLQIAAAEFDDQAMATAAQSKNSIVIAQLYDRQAKAAQDLKSSSENLTLKYREMEQKEKIAQMRAAGINNAQQLQETVDAIGQYRTAPRTGRAGNAIMQEVYKAYPDYDEGNWIDHKIRAGIPARVQAAGDTAAERTAATRGANLEMIMRTARALIPQAAEASDRIPRGSFVPLNELLQTADSAIGDPNLKAFKAITLNLAETWARTMNPTGQMTVAYFQAAKEIIGTADSPQAYKAVLETLNMALERELGAVKEQREHQPIQPLSIGKGSPSTIGQQLEPLTQGAGGIVKNELGVPPAMGLPPGAAARQARTPGDLYGQEGDMPLLPQGWKVEQVQ